MLMHLDFNTPSNNEYTNLSIYALPYIAIYLFIYSFIVIYSYW